MVIYFSRKGMVLFKQEISDLEKKLEDLQIQTQDMCENGGDLWHDNAGYERLVEEIRMADKRVTDAYAIFNQASLIEYPKHPEKVTLGSRVSFMLDEEMKTYEIVGYAEGDLDNGRIVYNSPLAKALLGHVVGDEYTVKIADKQREIEIIDINGIGE